MKEQRYNQAILKILLEHETIAIAKLAEYLGVSEKTARSKVEQLESWLKQENLGYIEKKPGSGIRLCSDQKQEILTRDMTNEQNQEFEGISRDNQLIGVLLKIAFDKPVTLQTLAEYLYLSAPTVSVLLKSVCPWFEKHHLKVESVRGKGIVLLGEENSYRQALVEYMVYLMPEITEALFETYVAGVDYTRIKAIVVDMENSWRIQFAENSFRTAWLMVCLSVKRYENRLSLDYEEKEESLKQFTEYLFAKSIYDRIQKEFSLSIPEEDIFFLTLALLTARKMGSDGEKDIKTNPEYFDEQLHLFVKEAISTIMEVLNVNLSDDKILYDGLMMHLRSAIFRMRYGQAYSDDIGQFVKAEYKQVYLASWSTSPLFEKYYGVQITENEIANIALYIQSAMIRQTISLSALLVTNVGLGASQLMAALIRKNIPEIKEIKVISEHDFKGIMCNQYDVIFTNIKLKCSQERVVHITNVITVETAFAIRERIRQIRNHKGNIRFQFSGICHPLFRVGYMLVHPQISNKEELLNLMVEKLVEKGDVTPEYLENVMERERATTTAIGDGVAIPHGNNDAVNESRVVTAILDEPILWHGELVDVVFLLALKMETSLEKVCAQQFYKDFICLTENEEFMRQIRQIQTGLDLYQYFIK